MFDDWRIPPQAAVPNRLKSDHSAFEVNEEWGVMATHVMGAVPQVAVRSPGGNKSERHDQITRALDFLFLGYSPAVMSTNRVLFSGWAIVRGCGHKSQARHAHPPRPSTYPRGKLLVLHPMIRRTSRPLRMRG